MLVANKKLVPKEKLGGSFFGEPPKINGSTYNTLFFLNDRDGQTLKFRQTQNMLIELNLAEFIEFLPSLCVGKTVQI